MLFKSMLVSGLLLMQLLASHAHAAKIEDSAFTISSVSVTEVRSMYGNVELPANPIGEIIQIVDGLLALGKKVWPIIEAGKPVITNKLSPAINIIPHLEREGGILGEMEKWSRPEVRSYRVSYKNGYNSEVIAFTFTLFFQHSGVYNGVGSYVGNLTVQASEVYVAWGFNFEASSELVGIANVGTSASPVASAIIKINYIAKNIINEHRGAQSVYVDGNGNVQVLKQE